MSTNLNSPHASINQLSVVCVLWSNVGKSVNKFVRPSVQPSPYPSQLGSRQLRTDFRLARRLPARSAIVLMRKQKRLLFSTAFLASPSPPLFAHAGASLPQILAFAFVRGALNFLSAAGGRKKETRGEVNGVPKQKGRVSFGYAK